MSERSEREALRAAVDEAALTPGEKLMLDAADLLSSASVAEILDRVGDVALNEAIRNMTYGAIRDNLNEAELINYSVMFGMAVALLYPEITE